MRYVLITVGRNPWRRCQQT